MRVRELSKQEKIEIEKEMLEEEKYNSQLFDFDLSDLDEWAEKELDVKQEKSKSTIEKMEEWMNDCEKNGFKYR